MNIIGNATTIHRVSQINGQMFDNQDSGFTKEQIEQRLYAMFTYFDKLYTHLASFKWEDSRTSYSEFVRRFYDNETLVDGVNISDLSFIRDGNRAYTMQMALFGNYFFQRLLMRYKYHEQELNLVNDAWNEANKMCKTELPDYEYGYVRKNFKSYLDLAKKVFPGLQHEGKTAPKESECVSTLPVYTNVSVEPIHSSNDLDRTELTIANLLRTIENAKGEEIKIYNEAAEKYESEGLQKEWLIAGFGILLEAGATEEKLKLFAESLFEIEKAGLPSDKFIQGYLEQVILNLDIDDMCSWVQRFTEMELEEKRLREYLSTDFNEQNNEGEIGVGKLVSNILLNPISIVLKAIGTLIALLLH